MNTQPYTSNYRNEFGDKWLFTFCCERSIGRVSGSDVDWHSYPVIEGEALDLVLSSDEAIWLSRTWHAATEELPDVGIYRGRPTEFKVGSDCCYLAGGYCPICLQVKRQFDRHHCIWTLAGGTDDYFNLLKVCCTCHAVLTNGCVEDRVPRDLAAFFHQMMHFGMQFFPGKCREGKRHAGRNFLKEHPKFAKMVADFEAADPMIRPELNALVQRIARRKYIYFRDMALGLWSWDDHYARSWGR